MIPISQPHLVNRARDSCLKIPAAPKQPSTPPSNTRPGKLNKPARSASPSSRVHSHQVHPNQPSPSPSQLGNPSIYTAPPPVHASTRPSNPSTPSISFPTPHTPNIIAPPSPNPHTRPIRNSFHAGASPHYNSSTPPSGPSHTAPHAPHGLSIPPWQSSQPPPPQPAHKSASSLVAGIFDRLQSHRR